MDSSGETKREARTLTATWALLVSLTLGSFWLADPSAPISNATGWILGIATLKSHVIAGVFMEMRRGPRVWAAVMSGFLIAEVALVIMILS
jgi:hypothetical protein